VVTDFPGDFSTKEEAVAIGRMRALAEPST
jgi:hypothetical protein